MGRKTPIFKQYKLSESEKSQEKLSFSIVNISEKKDKISLDLEGQSEIDVEIFIN